MPSLLEELFGGVQLDAPTLISIERAYLCVQCRHVGDCSSMCAGCNSSALMSLGVILGTDDCEATQEVSGFHRFYGS